MLWYLLKTWAGREEELAEEIRRTVPPYLYDEVFVIRNERIWRRQGRSVLHLEPLFKGCVFLTCRETEPLFQRMSRVPFMAMQMAAGNLSMLPLMEKDAQFLERISGKPHVVRASFLLREDSVSEMAYANPVGACGRGAFPEQRQEKRIGVEKDNEAECSSVYRVSGPLTDCLESISGIEFRKRFVKVDKKLWGEDRTLALGVILREDAEMGLLCGGREIPAELPEQYRLLEVQKGSDGETLYRELRRLAVLPGGYEKTVMAG